MAAFFSVTQRINKTTPWSSCFMAHLWLRDFMKVREWYFFCNYSLFITLIDDSCVIVRRKDCVQHWAIWTIPSPSERLQQFRWMFGGRHGWRRDWVSSFRSDDLLWPGGQFLYMQIYGLKYARAAIMNSSMSLFFSRGGSPSCHQCWHLNCQDLSSISL